MPWETIGAAPDPDDYQWELYNLTNDFSQAKNIAKENPEKLRDLQALFWVEAAKYNVLPSQFQFWRPHGPINPAEPAARADGVLILPRNDPYSGSQLSGCAQQVVPHHSGGRDSEQGAEGVLATQGGRFGGWSLLMLDGKPMFAYAYTN